MSLRAVLSAETLQAIGNGKIYLKDWKMKNVLPRLLHLINISFKTDGEIKSCSDKQKFKTTQYHKRSFRTNVKDLYSQEIQNKGKKRYIYIYKQPE